MTDEPTQAGGVPIAAIRQLYDATGPGADLFADVRQIVVDPFTVTVTWHLRRDGKLHLVGGEVEQRTAQLAIDRRSPVDTDGDELAEFPAAPVTPEETR